MAKKRTYQAAHVERLDVMTLLPLLTAGCIVALDAAKTKFVVALATLAGEVVKLFRFQHPVDTHAFLRVVEALKSGVEPGRLVAAMEPTGTYGDAVRHQLGVIGVPVQMVSPKRTHDSQSLFDGVASSHDPKSAVLIAKLCSLKLATPWSAPSEEHVRLRALVDLRRHEFVRAEACFGRLEALMARHWPEFGRWMSVHDQKSAIALLTQMPNPKEAAANADTTREVVRRASRGAIDVAIVDGLIADAAKTTGVPMVREQEEHVSTLASQIAASRRSMDELEKQMVALTKSDETFARIATWMGTSSAAIVTTMCEPRQYATARQLEKACGLNLREKSSGEHRGQLHITKRGPGLVRQALYMFALRMIDSDPIVRAWYKRRRGYTEESKQRAVTAVMRKLVRALFHVAKGSEFDAKKLFDTRRLTIETTPDRAVKKPFARRTTPRSSGQERSGCEPSARAST